QCRQERGERLTRCELCWPQGDDFARNAISLSSAKTGGCARRGYSSRRLAWNGGVFFYTSNIEHRTPITEHRTPTTEHRAPKIRMPHWTLDVRCSPRR